MMLIPLAHLAHLKMILMLQLASVLGAASSKGPDVNTACISEKEDVIGNVIGNHSIDCCDHAI